MRIARAIHNVDSLEKQLAKSPERNVEITGELARWRRALDAALRLTDEAQTERKVYELQQSHLAITIERSNHHRHLAIFSRVARWQHLSTYLLYLVLIMNVVITTFGISGESFHTFARGAVNHVNGYNMTKYYS